MTRNKLLLLLALLMTAATGAWADETYPIVYDFEAVANAGENPANKNGAGGTGQGFYGWESEGKTDWPRQDYKGYDYAEGSVLPKVCHVWRRSDRINGNVSNGGLQCPSDKQMAVDGLTEGLTVTIIYDATNASSKEIVWAIGDGSSSLLTQPRATATINGVEAVPGQTTIKSGDVITVNSVTEAQNGSGYIVFKVMKDMVIKKIIIDEAKAAPAGYTVSMKSGVKDADKWTVKVGEGQAQALPIGGLKGDGTETVTLQYNGRLKVKGVKATSDAAPAAVPVTAITLNKTETSIKVGATETLSVTSVLPEEATDKTYTWKTSDETKATVDQDGKVTAVAAGTVTIYAEANDGSGVKGNCSVTVTPATITVTWNNNDITGSGNSFTKDGVTITAGSIDFGDKNFMQDGTFTTTLGNFTKIEVTTGYWDASGTGWSGSGQSATWTGTPASSVSFSGTIMGMASIMGVNTKFVFTIEPTN